MPYTTLSDVHQKITYLFFKHLWNMCHQNKYNMPIALTGMPGTGKTQQAILFAWLLDRKHFNENSYCNTAKEFMQAIRDSKKGRVLIWDETATTLSSRSWYSLSNILVCETLQTYRRNRLTVFFVTPDINFIDVQARKLMRIHMEMSRPDTHMAICKIRRMEMNKITEKIMYPLFRFNMDGRMTAVRTIRIPMKMLDMVPKEIREKIEEKERMFKETLWEKNLRTVTAIESAAMGTKLTIDDMINEVIKNKNNFLDKNGKLSASAIEIRFNVGRAKSKRIKDWVEAGMTITRTTTK